MNHLPVLCLLVLTTNVRADKTDPLEALKDTKKVWRYEVLNGPTFAKLAKVKDAPNVWCSVAEPQKVGDFDYVRFLCDHDGKPKPGDMSLGGGVGTIASHSDAWLFMPDHVKSPDYGAKTPKAVAETGNMSGFVFPRALKGGKWRHTGTTAHGVNVQIVVKETRMTVMGKTQKVWLSEGKYWGPNVSTKAKPGSVWVDALLPGIGPALMCSSLGDDGGPLNFWCLRLISIDPPKR